jgi:hypothetical protein
VRELRARDVATFADTAPRKKAVLRRRTATAFVCDIDDARDVRSEPIRRKPNAEPTVTEVARATERRVRSAADHNGDRKIGRRHN